MNTLCANTQLGIRHAGTRTSTSERTVKRTTTLRGPRAGHGPDQAPMLPWATGAEVATTTPPAGSAVTAKAVTGAAVPRSKATT
jgi:hypothetical protein